MPIHDFGPPNPSTPEVGANLPAMPVHSSPSPNAFGISQTSHVSGGRDKTAGSLPQTSPYFHEEFVIPGFRYLDEAMKRYWSGIRVENKDGFRYMRVKIAGGDKSLMIWADDLKEGRIRLPVAAIDRTGFNFNEEKYSPAVLAMNFKQINTRGNSVAKVYRPVPYLVDYKMTIWAEHKRDAELILYQALTRFNPIAEFVASDGKVKGAVQIRFNGATDASDKEAGYDQHANIRYEITMAAEAWLPLPEQIIPTVLGQVTSFKEQSGDILDAPTTSWDAYVPPDVT